jgi:hypothetical protein
LDKKKLPVVTSVGSFSSVVVDLTNDFVLASKKLREQFTKGDFSLLFF